MSLFVLYRRNNLFDKYVPQILEGLPVHGTFTIPAGTDLEEHKDAFIGVLNELEKPEVGLGVTGFVSDDTCADFHFENLAGRPLELPRMPHIYLDNLFSEQITKWTKGCSAKDNLVWFAKQIQAVSNCEVKKVIVVKRCLADHTMAGKKPPAREIQSLANWIGESLGAHFAATYSVAESLQEAVQDAIIGGHPAQTMIVADRHSGLKDMMPKKGKWYNSLDNWKYSSMLFALPFETCAAQLMDKGTFPYSFDIVVMRNKIKVEAHIP